MRVSVSTVEQTMRAMATADTVLAGYPPRIRSMLAKIIANIDAIGKADVGHVELHFHGEQVKMKLTQHLS